MTERNRHIISKGRKNGDKHGKADHHAHGLKIVIMLGMLVIILCGIRLPPRSSCRLFSHYLLLLFLTAGATHGPLASAACTGGVDFVTIIVMAMVLLLAYLGSALNS